jgi:hypothetical protein
MKRISLTMNAVAQGLHAALGGVAVALPGWLWGTRGALVGTACAAVFAAVKEAWFDPKYEDAATAGCGLEDFAFWLVGILAAWLLYFLKSKI